MIKKIIILSALLTAISSYVFSQEKAVAFTINEKAYYADDIVKEYDSHNSINAEEKQSFNVFLENYIQRKIVLQEAYAQQIDSTYRYNHEMNSYRSQLQKHYLRDTITETLLIQDYLERYKEELNVNHAFIPFQSAPILPLDTVGVYKDAVKVRQQAIVEGFDNLDVEQLFMSYDIVVDFELQSGNLGWIRPLMLPIELEKIAYGLSLREITMPIRSSKGYHILQVVDKRPLEGNPVIEQVMFNFPQIPAPQAMQDSVYQVAIKTLDEIGIKNNFQEICDEFANTFQREDGCLYGEIQLGAQIPLPIINAAFNLKELGEVSKLVLSSYGYHILRLKDKRPAPSMEGIEKMLKNTISSDANSFIALEQRKTEERVKKFNLKTNQDHYDYLRALTEYYNPSDSIFKKKIINREEVLVEIGEQKQYTVGDFMDYIALTDWQLGGRTNKSNNNPLAITRFESMVYKTLSTDVLVERFQGFLSVITGMYEKEELSKNEVYASSLSSLSEGLLYTALLENEVWQKSRRDTNGLKSTFEKNRKKYKLPTRLYKGIIVHAKSEEALKEAENLYATSKSSQELLKLNEQGIIIQLEQGLWKEGDNLAVDHIIYGKKDKKTLKNFPYYTVLGSFIDSPEEYTDVKNQVEADFQQELEQALMKSLREKYTVKINKQALSKIK